MGMVQELPALASLAFLPRESVCSHLGRSVLEWKGDQIASWIKWNSQMTGKWKNLYLLKKPRGEKSRRKRKLLKEHRAGGDGRELTSGHEPLGRFSVLSPAFSSLQKKKTQPKQTSVCVEMPSLCLQPDILLGLKSV